MNTDEKVGIGLLITGVVFVIGVVLTKTYFYNKEIDRLRLDSMRARFALDTAGITKRGESNTLPQKYELIDSRGNIHEKLDGGKRHRKTHGKKNRSQRRRS
jgi:hypothetical protein